MTGAARPKSGKEAQWSTLPECVEHGGGDAHVTRLLVARLLFECYEQMGNTIKPDTEPVSYANGMITLQGNVWAAQAECTDYDVVMNHMAEVEGWHHNGDWHTAPSEWFVGFAMRQKSRLDNGYMMELTDDDRFRPLDALTRGEAATAVLRLYCSFGRYSDAQVGAHDGFRKLLRIHRRGVGCVQH